MTRETGIALIQVLMICTIIGMLMLHLGLSARDQVARAHRLEQRVIGQLSLQSKESEVLYSLLTENLRANPDSDNSYAEKWNFRGLPFEVDGAVFRIQDESGLQRIPLYGARDFVRLLTSIGVDEGRARRLGGELMRLQHGPAVVEEQSRLLNSDDIPTFPLQSLAQLRLLSDMDDVLFGQLVALATLYPTPGFNPVTAPKVLLTQILSPSQLESVEAIRAAGQEDLLSFWKVSGLEAGEKIVGTPGPGLRVDISLNAGGGAFSRQAVFSIRPYVNDAVSVWQRDEGVAFWSDELESE